MEWVERGKRNDTGQNTSVCWCLDQAGIAWQDVAGGAGCD